MNIAVVNNAEGFPENILNLVKGNVQVFDYSEASRIDPQKFDLLILSGGSQFPIEYNKEKLKDEIDLIRKSGILTLGICYGCELLAVAFGGRLRDKGRNTVERKPVLIKALKDHPLFAEKKEFFGYDAHRWVIDTLPSEFEVLAESAHGPEIIKHKTLPIYGFQFHPEKMKSETFGDELFETLLTIHGKK